MEWSHFFAWNLKGILSFDYFHSLWKEHGRKWPFTSATPWATVLIIITFCAFVDMAAVTMIRVRVSMWAFDKFRNFNTKKGHTRTPWIRDAGSVSCPFKLLFIEAKQQQRGKTVYMCLCLFDLLVCYWKHQEYLNWGLFLKIGLFWLVGLAL